MQEQLPYSSQPQGISLSEFNSRIERILNSDARLLNQWVVAETSDLRLNRSGHCYTELIEKDARGETVAKMGAVIWAGNYAKLYHKFLNATGQVLATGMKVLVNVSPSYHHLYGMKVVINDIDPSFTLGTWRVSGRKSSSA